MVSDFSKCQETERTVLLKEVFFRTRLKIYWGSRSEIWHRFFPSGAAICAANGIVGGMRSSREQLGPAEFVPGLPSTSFPGTQLAALAIGNESLRGWIGETDALIA